MRLHQEVKVDTALAPQALDNGNVGDQNWIPMRNTTRALIVAQIGAMASTQTLTVTARRATSATGTGAENVTGGQVVLTANTGVQAGTITAAAVAAADSVTINGVTLTGVAATPGPLEFIQDAADNTATATNLAAAINLRVPGVRAVAAAAVVTITSRDPGDTPLVFTTSNNTRLAAATTRAVALLEIHAAALGGAFTHLSVNVATTANTVVSATMLRDVAYMPDQAGVGAIAARTVA
jgi:hypothetical protein